MVMMLTENASGYSLTLFNPASTTYVKHFIGTNRNYELFSPIGQVLNRSSFAGYGNTTSAVNAIQISNVVLAT
jgi:hypothetical protein